MLFLQQWSDFSLLFKKTCFSLSFSLCFSSLLSFFKYIWSPHDFIWSFISVSPLLESFLII
jgi:hypothetical protein